MVNFYPSVSFSTKVIAPQPRALPWRSTIGVVGEFSRGPVGARRINADDIRTVYGYDASSGAVAAIQAMTMGAGEFVISRAVAGNTPARTSILLGSKNPTNVPGAVGLKLSSPVDLNPITDNENYTIGLTLDVNYVGEPLVSRTLYETVSTKATRINHTNFVNEQANLYIFATNFKQGGTTVRQQDAAHSLTLNVSAGAVGDHQIITIPVTDSVTNEIDEEAPNIKPGYIFERAEDVGNSLSLVRLLILSTPYKVNDNEWGVLVENLTETLSEDAVLDFKIKDPPESYYIFGYNLQTTSGRGLVPETVGAYYFLKPNEIYDDGYNENTVHSYFAVKAMSSGVDIPFKYDVSLLSTISAKTALLREDFGSTADEGIHMVFGEPISDGSPGHIRVALKGAFVIPFAVGSATAGSTSASSSLAFKVGTSFADCLKELRTAIYSEIVLSSLISEAEVTSSVYPYSLTLETAVEGSSANRIQYRVVRHFAGVEGSVEDAFVRIEATTFDTTEFNTYKNFKGAYSGPVGGYREFYSLDGTPIIRVTAVSPGVQNLRVSLQTSPMSSDENPLMILNVSATQDGNVLLESGQIRMDAIDATSGLFINTGLTAVNVFFMPLIEPAGGTINPSLYSFLPLRTAPPLGAISSDLNTGATAVSSAGTSVLQNLPLIEARDSVASDEESLLEIRKHAYLQAVKALASEDIAFLIIAGLPYGNSVYKEVFDEAFDQAKRATTEVGLRQVFVEAPYNMSPRQANFLSASVRSELVTIVNGHITMGLGNGTYASRVGLTGYYAGILSSRPPHIAPHANYGGQYLREVLNSTAKSDPDSKNFYSLGRVESLHFDRGLNRWKFLNGLTTSNDPTQRYVSVVRLRLQIMSDLQNYLQWVLSQPNTRALQRKVETAAATYMDTRLQEGWLLRLGPVVCNETNNSERDMAQGKLFLEISYVPIVPADFIFVNITEDYTLLDNLEFNTLPARS
jgi:hypothetical protein